MGTHQPQPVPADRHSEICDAALGFSTLQKFSIFRSGTCTQKQTISSLLRAIYQLYQGNVLNPPSIQHGHRCIAAHAHSNLPLMVGQWVAWAGVLACPCWLDVLCGRECR